MMTVKFYQLLQTMVSTIWRCLSAWMTLVLRRVLMTCTKFHNFPRVGSLVLSRKPAISLKRGKIGKRLLLMTNRKLHTRFRLVPKSKTLGDHEWPLRTLFEIAWFSEPITKIVWRQNLYYHRQRCSQMSLVSLRVRHSNGDAESVEGGGVWGGGCLPRKFWHFLLRNGAFWCILEHVLDQLGLY